MTYLMVGWFYGQNSAVWYTDSLTGARKCIRIRGVQLLEESTGRRSNRTGNGHFLEAVEQCNDEHTRSQQNNVDTCRCTSHLLDIVSRADGALLLEKVCLEHMLLQLCHKKSEPRSHALTEMRRVWFGIIRERGETTKSYPVFDQ